MLSDDIPEVSNSPFLNPLIIISTEGKNPRIELLQRFEGAKYMSSIDLSSAYLQVEHHEESGKYTAILFDSTVYQYKRVPYGFKNSLIAFVPALNLVSVGGPESRVMFCVGDIVYGAKRCSYRVPKW
jgi:hypothetical protein